jgi:hypothetical protein
MPFLFTSALLLAIAYPMIGTTAVVWVLAASQLALLFGEIKKGQVTGAGGFIFMSFLFFGVRPIFLLLQDDKVLFAQIFKIRPDLVDITSAIWWASAALLCFALGATWAPRMNKKWLLRRRVRAARPAAMPLVTQTMAGVLLAVQVLTLPVMRSLAGSGRMLYGSSFGAYIYDLPVPLQSLHIVALVVLLERYLRRKDASDLAILGFSGCLFLYFTWLMRDVTLFRGFYVTGVMVAGVAVLQRIKGRVGYAWLIVPIVVLQPFFQYLGGDRSKSNAQLAEEGLIDQVFENQTIGEAYLKFYDSGGDMNIFDTFVAATKAEPRFYPYAWSWIYVPLHFVPRAFWQGKPEKGITQDVSFTRGAPYSPGIAGFFLLDGGLLWMLLSMLVLGYLISSLDWYILTMPRGYLQYCLIGIVTVNAMFLTRFFLWQYFYQMMYAVIPIAALAWFFRRSAAQRRAGALNQGRSMGGAAAMGLRQTSE